MKRISLLVTRHFAALMLLVSTASLGALVPASSVFAGTPVQDVCSGVGLTGGTNGCGSGQPVNDAIAVAINILSVIVGVAAVVMIIVAGARFALSGGDANKVKAAQSSIIYALVGVVVVVLAQVLVHFVIGKTL